MSNVFISYAKKDRNFVANFAATLERLGVSVWWDRKIEHGTYFDRAIECEIKKASAVIIVWSPDSRESDWCRAEAALALEMKKLLPISIRRSNPPLRFKFIHTGDFSDWDGQTSSEVFELLCRDLRILGVRIPPLVNQALGSVNDPGSDQSDDKGRQWNLPNAFTVFLAIAILSLGGFSSYLYWDRELIRGDRDGLTRRFAEVEDSAFSAQSPGGNSLAAWPVRGRIITQFGSKSDGIDIDVPEGTPVKAPGDAVVAYAGNELKGYGNLILLRHSDGYVTAYAHLSQMRVKRGDRINRGQIIALTGHTGSVSSPQLHFEVREGSTPVDPLTVINRDDLVR